MASAKVADYLLEGLRSWGVQHVFAYVGAGSSRILAAGAGPTI